MIVRESARWVSSDVRVAQHDDVVERRDVEPLEDRPAGRVGARRTRTAWLASVGRSASSAGVRLGDVCHDVTSEPAAT